MVRDKSNQDRYYLEALQRLMDSGWPVTHVACKPDEWAEIDFHPDLTSLRKRLGETVESVSLE